MAEKKYIEREKAVNILRDEAGRGVTAYHIGLYAAARAVDSIPAADVRPVVTCTDCKYNNACLTQAFVEEASRVPFDRNTFFCADGKRDDDA